MHFTPFILQTLISNVSLDDAQASSQSTSSSSGTRLGWVNRESRLNAGSRLASGIGWGSKDNNKVTVESVEAWGTSDGHIIHYGVDDQISSENSIPNSFQVSKIHLGFGKRIVERIMLFPQISVAVVLCDSTLSFYLLPNMEQLSTTKFPFIKGVTCFCHDVSMEGKVEEDGSVKICAMKRRMIHIYSIKDQCTEEKGIQLPDGAITACQYGQFVCLADNQRYKLIDLKEKKLEDVMPYSENKSDRNSSLNEVFKPIITVIGDSEFLLTLPADAEPDRGMWEPVRGTLQWQSFPRAIGVELPYVVALLRNNYIEVHNIMDQQVVQSVQLSSKSRTISTGPGIKVQVAGLTEKLKWENGSFDNNNSKIPQQSSTEQANFLATVPTRLIIAGSESVDAMLDANCVEEALEMAEQAISTATPENVHSERMRHEFNYIHQKSGFIYLGETFFDLAVSLFEKGKTDPRILIRLFPEMREVFVDDEHEPIYMYSGVKAVADRLGSIEDIVSSSMIKNYDPHIKPDIDTSPATQELRKALITNAKDMLQKFLTWDRGQRKSTSNALTKKDKVILKAVDNALLRLYTESDSEDLLRNLLESDNECDLDLCKKVLEENEKFYPFLIDQENSDLDFPDGLKQMSDLLAKLDDQELVWECASWVIHKNEIIGATIFILQDAKKPLLVDPSTVLKELRSVGKEGLKLFLEYLVDTRKSQEEEHHTEYVLLSIQDIKAESLKKETRLKFDALKFTEHKQSGQTYLSFLMNQPMDDSFSQARTKLILFLQSSNLYKADEVLLKLKEAEILKAELAVVYGK
ncbi:1122_t:CDS:10, partial [Diversispora eburnea]